MGRVRFGLGRVGPVAAALTALVAVPSVAFSDTALPPPRHVVRAPDGAAAPVAPPTPLSAPAPAPAPAPALVPAPAPAAAASSPAPPPLPPPTSSSGPAARPPPSPASVGFEAPAPRAPVATPALVPVLAATTTRLTAVATRFFPADLDGGRGTLGLWRGLVEMEGTIPTSSSFTWKWGAQAEMDVYEFSDVDRVVAGAGRLLEEAYLLRAGPGIEWKISDRWSTTLGVFAQSAVVSGVSFDDTMSFGGVGTVRFRVGAGLGVRVGALAGTNLDGSTYLIPIASVDGGDDKGPAGPVRFSVRGSGCRVGYTVSPSLSLGVAARYDAREWRLAPSDRVPEGFLDDTRVQVGVDVQWTIRKDWTLGLEVGADVYHEIGIDDRDGDRVTIFEAEPAPYLAFSLTWML